jgi:hypothetical protein
MRRPHPSFLITIIYCLFMILYTGYVSTHLADFGGNKEAYLFYYLKLLATGSFVFFLAQGLAVRSTNWGILLLLSIAVLIASVLTGWLIVLVFRIHSDPAGMMGVTLLALAMSWFSLRFIASKKGKKRRS